MKLFKRCKWSIVSSIESLVGQIENHEALVDSAIRETREAADKAKIKLHRVRRDDAKMQNRIQELANEIESWNERAKKANETDRARAIECIRRRNEARRELEQLKRDYTRHSELETQLSSDLKVIEARIAELKRKKNEFSAREFRAKALNSSPVEVGCSSEGFTDLFDRWEDKLVEVEAFESVDTDSFERSFKEEEESSELEADLEELLQSEKMEEA